MPWRTHTSHYSWLALLFSKVSLCWTIPWALGYKIPNSHIGNWKKEPLSKNSYAFVWIFPRIRKWMKLTILVHFNDKTTSWNKQKQNPFFCMWRAESFLLLPYTSKYWNTSKVCPDERTLHTICELYRCFPKVSLCWTRPPPSFKFYELPVDV